MSTIATLGTPYAELLDGSLLDLRNMVGDGRLTIAASVQGMGCTHVLYLSEDADKAVYAVQPEGPISLRDKQRQFAVYEVPGHNHFPLVQLLVEAAHNEVVACTGGFA